MKSYIIKGMWCLIHSLALAVILYAVYLVILGLLKKRDYRHLKELPKLRMAAEFLLLLYSCAILNITGIIGMPFFPETVISKFLTSLSVPFVGASIKMVTLNVLLFVPYGFLLPFAFKSEKWNWKRALLVGFLSTLIIEVLQLFGARMFELDDIIANTGGTLIGFLINRSVCEIAKAETRKRGFIRIISTVAITAVVLFGLSFVSNGDLLQAENDEFYNEMEIESEDISTFKIYGSGKEKEMSDCELYTEDWLTMTNFYDFMNIDISNNAAFYVCEQKEANTEEIVSQNNGCYIEVTFDTPYDFRFYNNRDWVMENVKHILYRVDDGTLWYGSDTTGFSYAAVYSNSEYEFIRDEDLYTGILNTVG